MIDDVRRTRLFPFCVTRCAEMHSLIGPESFLSDVHAERDQSTQFILRGHFLKISDELVGVPVWPCQDLGTRSRTAGSGSGGKEAGRAIAMETMWLAYR